MTPAHRYPIRHPAHQVGKHGCQARCALIQSQFLSLESGEWQGYGTTTKPSSGGIAIVQQRSAASARPDPRRWTVAFAVIGILVLAFSLITFWGLASSDWLYGTYGQVSQEQWNRIAGLRELLAEQGLAPNAVYALDDALLVPHPSTEQVLFDLQAACAALEANATNLTARSIASELSVLITQIDPGFGVRQTAWPTPRVRQLEL